MHIENSNTEKKPVDIEEYKKWYKEKFFIEVENKNIDFKKLELIYKAATVNIIYTLNQNSLVAQIDKCLLECADKYYSEKNGYFLFSNKKNLDLVVKPFASILDKTYRMNVLNNANFPNAPVNGWVNHTNWFEKIKDIFRCEISVKYLDGVDFLILEVGNFCEEKIIPFRCDYEVRDAGYYAVHTYFGWNVEIMDLTHNTKSTDISIELQISTQLQEVIKKLLHNNYARDRICKPDCAKPWQWNYETEEFFVNYLGHTLHYIEGLILKVRDDQDKSISKNKGGK